MTYPFQNKNSDKEPGYALLSIAGNEVKSDCNGLANLAKNIPIDIHTNFRMASMSKQFTAMCILILFEQKGINLDSKLSHFFEHCHKNYKNIRIKQLLSHTSGIWDYEWLIPKSQTEQVLDDDVWNLVNTDGRLYFKPGTEFRYSNSGFCILTVIAQKVAKMPYPKLIKKLIFDSLSMDNTCIYEAGKPVLNRALGYIPGKEGGFELNDQNITTATKGDGCVYTSLVDYQKWHEALFTEKLLPKRLMQEISTAHASVNNSVDYGYGWFLGKEEDGSDCMFHSGETSGFLNIVFRNPSQRKLIVIFTNRNDGSVANLFKKAADKLGVNIRLTGLKNQEITLFDWMSEQYG